MTQTVEAAPLQDDRVREEILSREALDFVAELHGRFGARRHELLAARRERAAELARGGTLDFLPETREIREGDWPVAAPPRGLPRPARRDHRADRPQARHQRAQLGRARLHGRLRGRELAHLGQPGRRARQPRRRDRGHDRVHELRGQGVPRSPTRSPRCSCARAAGTCPRSTCRSTASRPPARSSDFGLHVFHGGRRLAAQGRGVFFYLPKLEHHLEARLWNDAFAFAEEHFGLARGTLRATVLIETLPAAFQMDEILYELREHSLGLNAGRWDYIFSMIKCFRDRPEFVLPDRNDVKMTVPFMRAYSELLVKTCHARGAFAMGGMAALIPSRKDAEANERAIAAVREDKQREAEAGFDGTWVAHPDVVAGRDGGVRRGARRRARTRSTAGATTSPSARPTCSTPRSTPGEITEEGLRNDVNVGFQYISFWLGGRGAAGINNLMEDAATAEISRSQIWQWVRHGKVTRERVLEVLDEETAKIRAEVGDEVWEKGRPERDAAGVRAGRAGRGVPRVPHAAGVRAARLSARGAGAPRGALGVEREIAVARRRRGPRRASSGARRHVAPAGARSR